MAQLSLGECKWRMIRMVLKKKKFRFEDARNQTRHDRMHFDWLIANGLFASIDGEWYELTEKGKAAADLGYYDFSPSASIPMKAPRRSRV
jgi:hypothetical protein